MGRAYESCTNGLVLTAVILAGLALSLLSNYIYCGVARESAAFPGDWPLVLACGILGGAVRAGFSWAAHQLLAARKPHLTHHGR